MTNKKNILVTGADGQLGMELRSLAELYQDYEFFFASKNDLQITDTVAVEKYFTQHAITHCINCAAYTAVDKAEREKEIAFENNGIAVGNIAAICKKNDAVFIHFSTDYVFNGGSTNPYKETDVTNPVNLYGATKLMGEQKAFENNPASLIIRTSWLYSSYGKNFVKTMLKLMCEKESLSVVDDQFGSPTYANDLAKVVMKIIVENEKPTPGIYNYSNSGAISWYEFALAIKDISTSSTIINPILTSNYPTPAKRPGYSVLDTSKIQQTFNIKILYWKNSLMECISKLMI